MWSRPSAAFPTLVFRPRPDYVVAVRLTEIRFEGLVGLTPPLSCALPLRTGRLFDCGTGCRDYSTAPDASAVAHAFEGCPRLRSKQPNGTVVS